MTECKVENWLSDSPDRKIEYSEYWNDEQNEQDKAWNILDGDFTKMESYLAQIGLVEDLRECLDACRARRGSRLGGVGIDLAAGNLWASPHLFGCGDVEKLYCLEFSKHRLLKLGPKVLEHYQVPNDKVVLVYGSFYDLHLPDGCLDFALLSAAFHHAEDPNRLLAEIRRVLKPDGVLMMIGEHIPGAVQPRLPEGVRHARGESRRSGVYAGGGAAAAPRQGARTAFADSALAGAVSNRSGARGSPLQSEGIPLYVCGTRLPHDAFAETRIAISEFRADAQPRMK